jgi:hypothetical protein
MLKRIVNAPLGQRAVAWGRGGRLPEWAVATCLFVIAAACSTSALAQGVAGGGDDQTDCFVTYQTMPAPNLPASKPKHLKCADQDIVCGDMSPVLGSCAFQMQVTFNSTAFPPCAPTDLPADGFLIPYSGNANDDHPKNVADFEIFQNFAETFLPLTAMDTDVTSGFSNVTVPMQIRFTSKGPVYKTSTVTMHPTMCTTPLVNGKCTSGLKDADKFKLICTPAKDGNGDPISPCTGVTSTFQQIQEHIFDRKCSTQASCHGSTTSLHDLCLKPNCDANTRHAISDLVGVTPHNFAAATDGLLRVDPMNPGNSYIMKKILGELDSPSGGPDAYQHRMPYNDPSHDRARKKLGSAEVQLISDWIMAGAPAMGFVATTAKGACQ